VACYAIGDIQGCKASLDRLLALIAFSPSRDQLWLVGDLVNRGPRSLDVLRWARDLGGVVTCVLGNHDIHLLARAAGAAGEKKRDTLDDVLRAPDMLELVDWLRQRPLLHVGDARVLVHAGLHPRWTVALAREYAGEIEAELRAPSWRAFLAHVAGSRDKKGYQRAARWNDRLGGGDRWRAILAYFVRARMLDADGRVVDDYNGPPVGAPANTVPWFAVADAAWTTHTVVFGHWAALGLDLGKHHIALDTGCVWGKSLTAYRLDDRMVFQVKAVEAS
jgi:bis(5'-nucleosyl)-tetraphosphatase (symmetrical)